MILGCGVDLIEVDRIERELTRRGGDPFDDLFTSDELAWCRRRRRPSEGFALAFAAKEAIVKALGTGLVGGMAWTDIEVAWEAPAPAVDPSGRGVPDGPTGSCAGPVVSLCGETAAVAAAMGVEQVHVTATLRRPVREISPGEISGGGALAAAWVVLAGARDQALGASAVAARRAARAEVG